MPAIEGKGGSKDAAAEAAASQEARDSSEEQPRQHEMNRATESDEKEESNDGARGVNDDDRNKHLSTSTITFRKFLDATPEALDAASSLKSTANDAFGRGDFERAVELYSEALEKLGEEKEVGEDDGEEKPFSAATAEASTELGATLHANLAATFLKLGDFSEARESADAALRLLVDERKKEEEEKEKGDDDDEEESSSSSCRLRLLRAKVLLRRAAALAGEGDLASAAAEAKRAERVSSSSSFSSSPSSAAAASAAPQPPPHEKQLRQLASQAAIAVTDYETRAAAEAERAKEEVVGKLKELGNSLLGRFGLSLDNFAAEKDPETGSYSIKFNQGGGGGGGETAEPLGRSGGGG